MTTVGELGQATVEADWSLAVERAYHRRANQVWEYGRRLGLDPGTAEEGMQEVFTRALRLPGMRRPDNLDAWLFRSMHNYSMDRHRQTRRVRMLVAPEPTQSPDIAGRIALWEDVDRLPFRQRQAVYLRFRADLDYASIAHVLEISESGARANVFRAIAHLRERMNVR